jgi:hypothetical protein
MSQVTSSRKRARSRPRWREIDGLDRCLAQRATLAGIYAATLLYWPEDHSPGFADTSAFLDRRLADVACIGQAKKMQKPP